VQYSGLNYIGVAVTGASGVIYGIKLIEELKKLGLKVVAIYTKAACLIARYELHKDLVALLNSIADRVYSEEDLSAPIASSSNTVDAMVIAPCSLNTLAKIACGIQDNLVTRVASCMLRLKRKLILVIRETPLSSIDLLNAVKVSLAGALVMPASPAFYHEPKTIDDLVKFIVGKVLDALGLEHSLYKRWGYS